MYELVEKLHREGISVIISDDKDIIPEICVESVAAL